MAPRNGSVRGMLPCKTVLSLWEKRSSVVNERHHGSVVGLDFNADIYFLLATLLNDSTFTFYSVLGHFIDQGFCYLHTSRAFCHHKSSVFSFPVLSFLGHFQCLSCYPSDFQQDFAFDSLM